MPRGRKKSKKRSTPLAELPAYPLDPLTGLALPVFVTAEDFVGPEDHQHHLNFGKNRPELQNVSGKAVRHSKVQYLPIHLHHDAYEGSVHDMFREPEELPRKPADQFMNAALSIARVMPRDAVDLKRPDPTTPRRLTDEQYTFISSPWITNVEGAFRRNEIFKRYEIGRFFVEHALQMEFVGNVVGSQERVMFLNATHDDRIKELGNQIIRNAVREALRPVQAVYHEAKAEGMVSAARPDLMTAVAKVVPAHRLPAQYDRLRKVLIGEDEHSIDLAA